MAFKALEDMIHSLMGRVGRVESRVTATEAQAVPSGTVNAFAGATAPTGYLLCDGSVFDPIGHPGLYAAIGTTYGGTSGAPLLPNLKGRVPVGRDSGQTEFDTLGETGGAKTHTLTTAEMPSHDHAQYVTAGIGNDGSVVHRDYGSDGVGSRYSQGANTGNTGGGGAHNNLQPYMTLNYIIKT